MTSATVWASSLSPDSATLTWIMPVRNALPHLHATLNSLAEQRCASVPVLAYDDGSTDGSAELLRAWIGDQPHHRLPGRVLGGEAVGLGEALRRLVQSATTPWLARIDADDIALPDRLNLQWDALQRQPALDVLGGQICEVDAEGQPDVGRCESRLPCDHASIAWGLRFGNPIAHPTVLLRREAVLAAGNYQAMQPGQDHDLWVRMASRGARLGNVPDAVLHYRRHRGSVSQSAAGDARARFDARRLTLMALLMPGVTALEAQRLLRVVEGRDKPKRGDVQQLRHVAQEAARRTGLDENTFTRTALFDEQLANVRRRLGRWGWRCRLREMAEPLRCVAGPSTSPRWLRSSPRSAA